MTHDELLVLLKGEAKSAVFRMDRNAWLILCDVVELHKAGNGREAKCVACAMQTMDCPTIKAIEKELT